MTTKPTSRTPLRREGSAKTVFHRYSRKAYAAFQSCGHEVCIGVLSVAMLSTQQVTAQTTQSIQIMRDTTVHQEESLDELTVTGAMAPLTQMQQARIVSVITSDEIQRAAASTLNDLLKTLAPVDVRQRGGFSIQTDISIDGATFDQVTVLLNGVNITNPHTGHLTMDLPLNTYDIERIELLEGASSRIYGASTFGGAINIVTRGAQPSHQNAPFPSHDKVSTPPNAPSLSHTEESASPNAPSLSHATESAPPNAHSLSHTEESASPNRASLSRPTPTLSLSLSAGSWGTVAGEASFGISTHRTAHYVSAGASRSDGGADNSDFRRLNAFYNGRWQTADNRQPLLSWQFGISDKRYGANTFYSPKFPNQWEANTRYMASVTGDFNIGVTLRPSFYWNRSTDHFQLIRDTPTGENFHRTDVLGGGITAHLAWLAGKSAIAANVRHERIASSNLGHEITPAPDTRTQQAAPESQGRQIAPATRYTHADSRTQYSLSLEHNVLLPRWTFSVGLMAAVNNAIDHRVRLYPGIDISYRPTARWRIYASYNRGFRMPTFTDLYYTGAERQGNGSLLPEQSHAISLAATFTIPRLTAIRSASPLFTATARLFYHRGSHMIDWVKHSATDQVYYAADFDLDNIGATVSAQYAPIPAVRLQAAYTFIHQWRHDALPVYKSSYAGEYLRHKFTASLAHPIYGPLTAQWHLRVCDRVGSYEAYENAQPTGTLHPYAPYAVLDCRLRLRLTHFDIALTAENITNRRYYDFGNIPQPGICLIASLRWTL